jgi:Cyanate lyase C-terminal domain
MNVAQAQAAASMLELDQDVAQALQAQPTRGALDAAVPVDPTIYRFYEVLQGYGPTIKELIHEQCGDEIMSAINFRLDVKRVPDRLVTAVWSPSMESSFPTSGESAALLGTCRTLYEGHRWLRAKSVSGRVVRRDQSKRHAPTRTASDVIARLCGPPADLSTQSGEAGGSGAAGASSVAQLPSH